jgi:hypothetical protein
LAMRMTISSCIISVCVVLLTNSSVAFTNDVAVLETEAAGTGLSDHVGVLKNRHEQITLFRQPNLPGINNADGSSNILVPAATHIAPPMDRFVLAFWEKNPRRSDGLTVPTKWNASTKTGLYVNQPHSIYQSGFDDSGDLVSTAQVYGNTIGAYLNSADLRNGRLPDGTLDPTFIMAPGIQFSAKPSGRVPGQVQVFQQPNSALTLSMELQVPTAVDEGRRSGCSTYVFMDIGFLQSGTRNKVSYDVGLFFHDQAWHRGNAPAATFYDPRSHYFVLNTPLVRDNPYITHVEGTTTEQGEPWIGFRLFIYDVTYSNFRNALGKLVADFPDRSLSVDPADYVLTDLHLNAAMQYLECKESNKPVELGWSMRRQELLWNRR